MITDATCMLHRYKIYGIKKVSSFHIFPSGPFCGLDLPLHKFLTTVRRFLAATGSTLHNDFADYKIHTEDL